MKAFVKAAVSGCLAAVLVAAAPGSSAGKADLLLLENTFSVQQWKSDGSHLAEVKGTLQFAGKPVAGAILQAGGHSKKIETRDDGTFQFILDKSLMAEKQLRVVSLDHAKLNGKPIDRETARHIFAVSVPIKVYFPVEVTRVENSLANPGHVEVHARLIFPAGDVFSFFRVDKYRINGRVTDAGGKAVKDAVVWLDRDHGEGFAKSTPTNEKGEYQLFYVPEEEETNLTVTIGSKRYTLPAGKFMKIPKNTSVSMEIRLPEEGTVLSTRPPYLVTSTTVGAMYTGILAGLDVPSELEYAVTIPDREGRFVLTVPKQVWERNPAFFETNMTKFVGQKEVLTEGDTLPSNFLEAGENAPRKIKAHIAS